MLNTIQFGLHVKKSIVQIKRDAKRRNVFTVKKGFDIRGFQLSLKVNVY